MRLTLLTNTDAGDGGHEADELAARLGALGAEVEVHDVREAAPLDGAAADGGGSEVEAARPDRLVVAGGDGSLGPAAVLAQRIGVPLAVVPTGTANDFARALDLPRDVEDACALAAAEDARVRGVEIGSAGGRPFLNAASAGLAVVAAREASDLKGRLGALAYAVGAMKAGVTGEPLHLRVRVDGEERFAGDAWQVVVACTGHFGGGASIGDTEVDDGHLDVAVVPAGHRLALVWRAVGMRTGLLRRQDGVLALRGSAVEVDGVSEWNVDGERCEVDPPRFGLAGRVQVVVP